MSTDTLEKEDTETPLAIDPSTGLPVVPEDMFWRVADVSRREYKGWGSRYYEDITEPNVQLVRTEQIAHTRKVPDTHGKNWWNRNVVVSMKDQTYHVPEQVVLAQRSIMGFAAEGRKNVPENAVNLRKDDYYHWSTPEEGEEDTNTWLYDLPLNEDTIELLSAQVWRSYLEKQHENAIEEDKLRDRRLEKEKNERAKERLYGYYPPKTLVRA